MAQTMPAVVFERAGVLRLLERPLPTLRDDHDVLIRIVATGICGTDRGIALGRFPASPGVIVGHEAVGIVASTGDAVKAVGSGDRVVLNPTFYCGRCRPCRRGTMAHCEAKAGRELGVDCDGTMASSAVLHERFVHPLPAGMSLRRAVMIEPLACVLNNLAAAQLRPDDHVLVAGAGPIGALCALVLAARGARVAIVDRDPARAALARSALAPSVEVVDGIVGEYRNVQGRRPDVVVDTTGVLLEDALEAVADAGRIVVMGEREGAQATVALRSVVTRGIRIVGAGPYAPDAFELAIDLADDLPLEALVTHTLALERYEEAFRLLGVRLDGATQPGGYGAMKVLLVSGDDLLAA
ncbi:MAG: hypothetical protein QOD83_1348 [Solirubrobacteraceae bacterium]|nr:hypothetical protein [Solirubrobacteraceae bacterium]